MTRPRLDIRVEDITVVVDTREQRPFELDPLLKTETGTLPTGDYAVKGLEHLIVVERKSLSDLIGCIGIHRERFEKEIQRLLAYEAKAIVVEAPWRSLEIGDWRSSVTPNAAMGTVIKWQSQGIPFHFAESRADGAHFTGRFLFVSARRRWRELQSFIPNLRIAGA